MLTSPHKGACGSAGRAPALKARGLAFESKLGLLLHFFKNPPFFLVLKIENASGPNGPRPNASGPASS